MGLDKGGLPPFAELLDGLFKRHTKPNGRPYANDDVASWIEANQGVSISQSYIWMLRNGTRDDPRRSHIEALAAFFGVPAGYFMDEATYREVERDRTATSMPQSDIKVPQARAGQPGVLLRQVSNLSPALRSIVGELINHVSELDSRKGG